MSEQYVQIIFSDFSNFLSDHCERNQIITQNQAARKKGSWGCLDQLLINKTITEEARMYRRNLFTVWLDYKKAFDSVLHDWIIKALKLAKVPEVLITAIDNLTRNWST